MIIKEKCPQLIANQRTDEVVVTTMGTTVPWGKISTHPLDYASVGSAMAVSYTHLTLPTNREV